MKERAAALNHARTHEEARGSLTATASEPTISSSFFSSPFSRHHLRSRHPAAGTSYPQPTNANRDRPWLLTSSALKRMSPPQVRFNGSSCDRECLPSVHCNRASTHRRSVSTLRRSVIGAASEIGNGGGRGVTNRVQWGKTVLIFNHFPENGKFTEAHSHEREKRPYTWHPSLFLAGRKARKGQGETDGQTPTDTT